MLVEYVLQTYGRKGHGRCTWLYCETVKRGSQLPQRGFTLSRLVNQGNSNKSAPSPVNRLRTSSRENCCALLFSR